MSLLQAFSWQNRGAGKHDEVFMTSRPLPANVPFHRKKDYICSYPRSFDQKKLGPQLVCSARSAALPRCGIPGAVQTWLRWQPLLWKPRVTCLLLWSFYPFACHESISPLVSRPSVAPTVLLPLLLQMSVFLAVRLKCNIILKCSGALTYAVRALNTQLCQGMHSSWKNSYRKAVSGTLVGGDTTKHSAPPY